MTSNPDREALLEALASAHRERGPLGDVRPHRAFFDLDDEGRAEAFELAEELRAIEAALDPDGLSATAREVLRRIQRPKDT